MAKPLITQTGMTSGGVPVMAFFPLVDTHGIPLSMAIAQLVDRGMLPDCVDFYVQATAHGWSESNTYTQMEYAMEDNFSADFVREWRVRMAFIRAMLHPGEMPRPLLPADILRQYKAGTLSLDDTLTHVVDRETGRPVSEDLARFMVSR